jgi:alkylation response protein AidB-like acyl-CoA dehydrogenase
MGQGNGILEAAAALRPLLRERQEEIDRARCIPPDVVDGCRAAGLYRMVVPRELGGAQVDQQTYMQAVELISEGDGSAGWNLATCVANAMATLSMPDEGVREVFAEGPDVVFGGTIASRGGQGIPVDGGYVVTGRWPFGSGCGYSQWLMGSFEVPGGDRPPVRMRGLFRAGDCTVIDNWDVTGLRGTGSHDWAVNEVFVPNRRTTPYPGEPNINKWSRWPGTLYQLPGIAFLAGIHFSPVATGIARAAIDSLTELAGSKVPLRQDSLLLEQPQVQEWVGRAEALLGSGQAYRAAAAAELWATVDARRPVTMEQIARCRLAANTACDNAVQATDLMYRAGGTTSIQWNHRLARCWRDVHAVAQHTSLLPEYYMLAGRALLGLDPGPKLSEPALR